MTSLLQPFMAAVWEELSPEQRGRFFGLLKDDDRRAILDVAREEQEKKNEEDLREQLAKAAQESLFWRDVKREADRLDRARSGATDSWKRKNIADLFDEEQEEPAVGAWELEDGAPGGSLFYAGKVNEIHGPSESGKSMVLLAVAAQEIRAGRDVAMIDYEDDGKSIVGRLRWVFGLTRDLIEQHFHYFNPETPLGEEGLEELKQAAGASLFIIDAVTEAMSVEGLDGRNENEVAAWYNMLPKRIASWGPAVVVVDHTPIDAPHRQIGSQHKKSGITGVSYTAEPVFPFTRGGKGMLRLRVAKDRPGGVRAAALPGKDGQQHWRGDFVIDGTLTPSSPQVTLRGVTPGNTGPSQVDGDTEEPAEGEQDFEPLSERQFLYLKGLSAAGQYGRTMAEMYADEEIPRDHKPNRQHPRKVIVEQLAPRGLTEPVPREKGRWRVTPKGISKIMQTEKDTRERLQKWATTPSKRQGSPRVREPQENEPSEP